MIKPGTQPCLDTDQIVDAAFSLIVERGMAGFSIRNLAKYLNISPMTIYGYFPSKQAIIEGVAERLKDLYDTNPIPGERWDDTVRRIALSTRRIKLKYLEVYRVVAGWAKESKVHALRVYRIHKNQGMPLEVIRFLWCTLDSYLYGFLHQEVCQSKAVPMKPISEDDPDYPWLKVSATLYNEESYLSGVDFIIEGVRRLYPDEVHWVTPT